jgi:DSF synthase
MSVSNVETLIPERTYGSIRCQETDDATTFWCHMHALGRRQPSAERACFTPQLVSDICAYQRVLGDRLRARERGPGGLDHLVLASDSDVFNLGGDLALFGRLIREGNRDDLLDYARACVRGVHAFHVGLGADVHSIALVQGDALGGGFEAALSCHTIVAEEDVGMGLPEVLFDLFPGMGAYSFLSRRIGPALAEKMMLEGNVYSSQELLRMGVVDVVVPKGHGVDAVNQVIRGNRRIANARRAMHQVRELVNPITLSELMRITEIWVDTALGLGEKSLRTMERLVRAQVRRSADIEVATHAG